jgi:hypothetical protein
MDVCRVTEVSRDSQSCTIDRTDVWDLGSGETWELPGVVADEVVGRSGADLVVRGRRQGSFGVLDVRTGRVRDLGSLRVPRESVMALGVDGREALVVTGPGDESGGEIHLGTVPLDRSGRFDGPVRRTAAYEGSNADVAGLLPDGRAVTVGHGPDRGVAVRDADGAARTLVDVPADFPGSVVLVATALADRPTVAGVEPPHVTDPRLVAAGAVLSLGVLAAGTLAWWRRRRSRGVAA